MKQSFLLGLAAFLSTIALLAGTAPRYGDLT